MENKEKMIKIIGDIHLDEKSSDEVEKIIDEIISDKPDVNEYWLLGDFFEKKKPSPLEYKIGTKILTKLLKSGKVYIVTGNHDIISKSITALDYSKYFNINVYYEKTILTREGHKIYLGHHFTDKGDKFKQDLKYKLSDLKQYDLVLLGHDHSFKKLADNVYHLGSIRRVHFSEVDYNKPLYAILEPKSLKIEFRELKSPIPMYEVDSIEKALQKPNMAKIRLVLNSFSDFMKVVHKIPELQKRFTQFSVKHNYKKISQVAENKEVKKNKSFDQIFAEYLQRIENKEVKKILKDIWNEK